MIGYDLIDIAGMLAAQWAIVFVINIVPALMPPTWVVLSYFYISNPQNIWLLVLIGVTASACGRYALARLSGYVTTRFASRKKKQEFDSIREGLQGRPFQKFIFTFIYALSPLPSNALFIAFGATKTKLTPVMLGFICGRALSYLFLVFTTQKVFSSLEATAQGNTNLWTIMIEVIGVIAIALFFLVDWKKIIVLSPSAKNGQNKKKWPKRK